MGEPFSSKVPAPIIIPCPNASAALAGGRTRVRLAEDITPNTKSPIIKVTPPTLKPICTRSYLLNFGLFCQFVSILFALFTLYFFLNDSYHISSKIKTDYRSPNTTSSFAIFLVFYIMYVVYTLLSSGAAHVLSERVGRQFALDELKAFIACHPELYMSAYTPNKCTGTQWKTIQFTSWTNEDPSVDISRIRWPAPFTILHIDEQLLVSDDVIKDAVNDFSSGHTCRTKTLKRCADSTFSRRMLVITGARTWWMSKIIFVMTTLVGLSFVQTFLLLKRATAVQITIRKRAFTDNDSLTLV
uniref:Uncharacterized protein n=1 Tax=Spongospora subterranea TaxID=70186 RepID=A0A0H5R408_9EUKA|eukprot:CRZ08935.1 hypothetical protein [Spongospora subterranea]